MPTMCIQTAVVRMDVTVGPLNAPHSSALWTRCLLPVNQIFMWRTKHLLAYADVQTNPKLWLHYSSTLIVCLSDSLDAGWGQFTTGLPKCLRLPSLLLPFFFSQNMEDAGSTMLAPIAPWRPFWENATRNTIIFLNSSFHLPLGTQAFQAKRETSA